MTNAASGSEKQFSDYHRSGEKQGYGTEVGIFFGRYCKSLAETAGLQFFNPSPALLSQLLRIHAPACRNLESLF